VKLRRILEPLYEQNLLRQCHSVPRHIAIIQDGNRRFARMIGINKADGHRAGADKTEEMLDWAHEIGIRYITLYSFSTENFSRDQEEVSELFSLFKEKFTRVLDDDRVHRYHIRVQMVGERSRLPPDLLAAIDAAEKATASYNDYYLNIALAYGGRNEIVRAIQQILEEIRSGTCTPAEIDSDLVERHLNGGIQLPPVDLIIRTGNDYRTSNFLPWLANGHESAVYFCAPYWPMFRKIDLLRAVRVYSQRVVSRTYTDPGDVGLVTGSDLTGLSSESTDS
jgi:tritrans,polycis-undecaprenyl-diphosphate synthase [geranylgeranyl-diphosphate specific]